MGCKVTSKGEEDGPQKTKQTVPNWSASRYGLRNQGATCYISSVLQVLFMTPEVHDRLCQDHQTDLKLKELFESLRNKTSGTETITSALGIENICQQRDAAEYLELILQKLSPQVSEIFQGKLTYTTECTDHGHIINEETNPFWTLPLSLRDSDGKTYSVQDAFDAFFKEKTYSEGNMVYCNTCEKKTEATSRCEMVQSPQSLTLLLKRLDVDNSTLSDVKSEHCVNLQETLHVKTRKEENEQYELYGIVNHMGSLSGGHYTSAMKSSENEIWYEFNDSHVEEADKQHFEKDWTYKSKNVCLLIYKVSKMPVKRDKSCRETSLQPAEEGKAKRRKDTAVEETSLQPAKEEGQENSVEHTLREEDEAKGVKKKKKKKKRKKKKKKKKKRKKKKKKKKKRKKKKKKKRKKKKKKKKKGSRKQ